MNDTLYFRQLKGGREFAKGDPVATQMDNFVYLIGDKRAGECLVVDPAWDVQGILDVAAADDMTVTGALVTHWHPDHVGGPLFGHDVQGLAEFVALNPSPVYVHRGDADMVCSMTGLSTSDLTRHDSGHVVRAGEVEIECLHTPGHTAGSQCFRCKNALIAGDTLFLQGCGRLDLPTADVDEMYRTLNTRLAKLPPEIVLYPGHDYGHVPHAPLGEVRKTNAYLQVPNLETWRRLMGA